MPFEFVYRRRTRWRGSKYYIDFIHSILRFFDSWILYEYIEARFFRSRLKCRRSFGKESRTNPAAMPSKSGYTYTMMYIEVICIARDRWHEIRSCNELKITDCTNTILSFFLLFGFSRVNPNFRVIKEPVSRSRTFLDVEINWSNWRRGF